MSSEAEKTVSGLPARVLNDAVSRSGLITVSFFLTRSE